MICSLVGDDGEWKKSRSVHVTQAPSRMGLPLTEWDGCTEAPARVHMQFLLDTEERGERGNVNSGQREPGAGAGGGAARGVRNFGLRCRGHPAPDRRAELTRGCVLTEISRAGVPGKPRESLRAREHRR